MRGVGDYDRTNSVQQGTVAAYSGAYDLAITGDDNGVFSVKDRYSGYTYQTRAGDFYTQTTNGVTYLVNNNGMRLQGFPALEDGGFGTVAGDIALDYPTTMPSVATTEVSITANVPASGSDSSGYSINFYGPNNDVENLTILFSKGEDGVNKWDLSFIVNG